MPGPLSTSVYLGPDVNLTFTKSDGVVAYYIINVIQRESGRLWTMAIGSQTDPVHVVFPNQTAGAYYDVTIVAYSGGISSNTRTAAYRVEVDGKKYFIEWKNKDNHLKWQIEMVYRQRTYCFCCVLYCVYEYKIVCFITIL